MVHAFVPQHLIDLVEYLKEKEFSDKTILQSVSA